MPSWTSSSIAESNPTRSSFLANILTSWTTWIPHPLFRSGEYMCLIALFITSLSSSLTDPRSSKNLLTVRLRNSRASTSRAIIAFWEAVKRQFPSADTSPPWDNLNTIERDWSSGCFQRIPFAWSLCKCRLCCSSRPITSSHAAAAIDVVVDWSTRSTDGDGSLQCTVGDAAWNVSATAVESHKSLPISITMVLDFWQFNNFNYLCRISQIPLLFFDSEKELHGERERERLGLTDR